MRQLITGNSRLMCLRRTGVTARDAGLATVRDLSAPVRAQSILQQIQLKLRSSS
jgi:hypothetical protein